jgi:hypothetical protein
VTFVPAPGVNVSVNVPGTADQSYALALLGSSYITISGGSASSSMAITATGADGAAAVSIGGVQGRPSGHNTLENLLLQTAADSLSSSSGFYGVLLAGYDEGQKDTGVAIIGCTITRHGQAGIAVQNAHGLRVESCTIRDWTQQAGFVDLRGIWLFSGVTQTVIRGNVVGNIRNLVNGWWSFGIENGSGAGSALLCSNNSIWGIASTGAGSDMNIAAGIWSSSALNNGDRYLYNSLFLYGTDNSTASGSRSSAMEFVSPAPAGLLIRNTIGMNTTVHGGGGVASRAFGIYFPASTWPAGDTCNRNDWWTPGSSGATGYHDGAVYGTLPLWRAATGQDAASLSADPRFVNARDLHVALGTSPVGNAGNPVSGETLDIDGETRSGIAPDIGCDEFGAAHIAVAVSLAAGWNMIANPVHVAAGTDSVRMLYPTSLAPYAFAFSPSTGYLQQSVLENGRGYWEKFASGGYAYPSGDVVLADTIALEPGWNMVGTISVPVDTASVIIVPAGVRSSSWFSFGGGYVAVDTLLPGRAYWVKASGAGSVVLQGPPPVSRPPIVRNSGTFSR